MFTFFYLFLQGWKTRSALGSNQKPTHYAYEGRSPIWHRSAMRIGRGGCSLANCTVDALAVWKKSQAIGFNQLGGILLN